MNVSNGFKRTISAIIALTSGFWGGGLLAKLGSETSVSTDPTRANGGNGLYGCGTSLVFLFLLIPAMVLVGFVSYFVSSQLIGILLQKKSGEPTSVKVVNAVGSAILLAISIVIGLILSGILVQLFRTYLIEGIFSVSRPISPETTSTQYSAWQIRIIIHFFATSAFAAVSIVASILLVNRILHKIVGIIYKPKNSQTSTFSQPPMQEK